MNRHQQFSVKNPAEVLWWLEQLSWGSEEGPTAPLWLFNVPEDPPTVQNTLLLQTVLIPLLYHCPARNEGVGSYCFCCLS